jgi:hypothetical protein
VSQHVRSGRYRLELLGDARLAWAARQHLGERGHGLAGDDRGFAPGEVREGSEQAANESWGQPTCGYPVPDARPLAADVSTAGHAYQSCTGDEPLSPENHQMGRGHETAHAGHFGHPYNYGGAAQPSGFGRGVTRHVAADKDS